MRLATSALIAAFALSSVPAAAAEKPKRDPGSRILCKEYGETGSRTRTMRVCKTKAEWDLEEHTNQQELSNLQRKDGGSGQTRAGEGLPGSGDIDRATRPQQ